jgi:hypothetical protein
VNRADTDSW